MINVGNKRYQLALWMSEDRTSPGLKIEFDSLTEAVAQFDKLKAGNFYLNGVLFEWRKHSATWELIDNFPK